MHLLWVFLIYRLWGFQPRRRFWVCGNLISMAKQKLTLNLTLMLKPSRKWSSPSTLSVWQYQAKEEASLNTHFFIILVHFLLHFFKQWRQHRIAIQENINFFHGPQRHKTPFFAKVCLPLQLHLWVLLSLSYPFFSKFKGSFNGKSRCWVF